MNTKKQLSEIKYPLVRAVIDSHEKRLYDLLTEANSDSFSLVKKRLEVGDISIEWSMKHDEWSVYMIIERKTYADLDSALAASSNRYREQKFRLKKIDKNIMKCYLFEGTLDIYIASLIPKSRKRHEALIKGAMFNTQFRDNFQVYKTHDLKESAEFIIKLCNKLPKFLYELRKNKIDINEDKDRDNYNHSELYSEKLQKKTYLDSKACYINQLCMIPLISYNRAIAITKRFQNMKSLTDHLIKEGPGSLIDLESESESEDTKKIGKKASENVYRYLLGIKSC